MCYYRYLNCEKTKCVTFQPQTLTWIFLLFWLDYHLLKCYSLFIYIWFKKKQADNSARLNEMEPNILECQSPIKESLWIPDLKRDRLASICYFRCFGSHHFYKVLWNFYFYLSFQKTHEEWSWHLLDQTGISTSTSNIECHSGTQKGNAQVNQV